jgi:hypothetical protein
MSKPRIFTGIAVLVYLASMVPAQANVISDWNAVTLQYVSGDPTAIPAIPAGRGGPPGLLDIALVQAAVHDAVQAIEGRFQPYYYSDPSKFGIGSVDAAVAAAAHRMLVLLYPGQQKALDALYSNYLTANAIALLDPGSAVGEAAASALHANHYRPAIPLPNFFGGTDAGEWRSAVPMSFLYLVVTEPFTLNRNSQFRPPPPPPLNSVRYAREYAEVEALGRASAHPNDQTDFARFWSGAFWAQWNEVLRQVSTNQALSVGDSARLFALANLAAADALIAVWDSKRHYNFWRPETAIRLGDDDRNKRTIGDMTWLPFLPTPPYSDYASGANGLTGAYTSTLQHFFGTDEMDFSVKNVNPAVITQERFYHRFSEAADEVVEVRIVQGIHFRSAEEEGLRLGARVAHWAFQKFLRPVPGSANQ